MNNAPEFTLLIILLAIAVLTLLPTGYLLARRSSRTGQSLLLVSTNEATGKLVTSAAKHQGYATVRVYRYEDALDRLKQDSTLRIIVIDDSVPQYEAGLLLTALGRLPSGMRPLILIQDNTELGQTSRSHRVEAVVSHPLTERAIESAIRQVSQNIVA
jgi:CheY-like chemotaxis protein